MNKLQQLVGRGVRTFVKSFGLDDLFLTGAEIPHFGALGMGGRATRAGVSNAYSTSWIAYSCIAKQAKDISAVPLRFLRDPTDTTTEDPSSPVAKMFAKPHQGIPARHLIMFMVTYLRLRGAFFLDFDDPLRPTKIIPYRDPLRWRPRLSNDRESLVGWDYQSPHGMISRLPSDLILGREVDPVNPWGWQSPLDAAADPLIIDREGDHLNAQTVTQGGLAGETYKYPNDLDDVKYDQFIDRLRARRAGAGDPPLPVILTNGIEPVDPKFTKTDLNILEQQERSAEKICSVYGMTPALLFKDDSPNKATFETRRAIYWQETLVPVISTITDALEAWVYPRFGLYPRFDLSDVKALQPDLMELVKIGLVMNRMNIPVSAINERLDLDLPLDMIPGADECLVSANLAPISAVIDGTTAPAPMPMPGSGSDDGSDEKAADRSTEQTEKQHAFKLTNALIRSRHRSALAVIERNKARAALSKKLTKEFRSITFKFRNEALKVVNRHGKNVDALEKEFAPLAKKLGNDLAEMVMPLHRKAAAEGALSIIDLLGQKQIYGTSDADVWRRAPELPARAVEIITERQNYIQGMGPELFNKITSLIQADINDDIELTAADVADRVRHEFQTSINRASMVGRTEIGTAFNVSRFEQMAVSGIKKHEWDTAGDDAVRDGSEGGLFDHVSCNGEVRTIGETFPCGLAYPQEGGGEPGNVINCRCSTIPSLEGIDV